MENYNRCSFFVNLFAGLVSVFIIPNAGQYVENHIGTVYGYVGETATLVCDLQSLPDSNAIGWYREDRGFFISIDERFFSNIPDDIKSRLSVTCQRSVYDNCELSISSLQLSDSGTYKCGYYYEINGNYQLRTLSTGTLTVRIPIGTVYGYIGYNATLACDLKGLDNSIDIVWYYQDSNFIISRNEILLYYRIPDEIEDRLTINCYRDDVDRCELTIASLTRTDSGTYKCGYFAGSTLQLQSTGTLTVGTLPSEDSPSCSLQRQDGSGSHLTIIGDEIYLVCSVEESDIPVILQWTMQQHGQNSFITSPTTGLSIRYPLQLHKDHIGAQFTCIILLDPAIAEFRNCSITPLPTITSTLPTTTGYVPSTNNLSFSDSITANKPALTDSNTSHKMSYLYVIIAVSVSLIVIGIVIAVLLKRRYKNNVISEQKYELTFNKECSINPHCTHDINDPDRLHESTQLEGAGDSREDQVLYNHTELQTDINREDTTIPVYAQVEKGNKSNDNGTETDYENVTTYRPLSEIHPGHSTEYDNETDEGLMYADLELQDTDDSNSPRIPVSKDATVYADIKGTLP